MSLETEHKTRKVKVNCLALKTACFVFKELQIVHQFVQSVP